MSDADEKNEEKSFRINDERWWLKDDVDLEEMDRQATPKKPSYIEELEQRVADMEQRAQEFRQETQTETDAVQQRLEREMQLRLEVERGRLAEPFLEVLDNFERLLQAGGQADDQADSESTHQRLLEGAHLVLKQLAERLSALGITAIPAKGEAFDPNTMEALSTAPVAPEQEGQVLAVLRTGYAQGERIIRPAGVQVGVAKQG